MIQTKTYRGIDLLDKIFEFTAMTPDQNQWNSAVLKSNPPRQIRFRQIQSLIQAFFGQTTKNGFLDKAKSFFGKSNAECITIQAILSGDFINSKTLDDYTKLIDFIKELVKEHEADIDDSRSMHVGKLIMPYQKLVKYKRQLIEMLTFNSGWLESGSYTSRFSIYLTNEITLNLENKYSRLDNALELFINPKELTFLETELVDHYKYPTENLSDIDIEYT